MSTGPPAQDLTMNTGPPAQDLTISTGPPAQDLTMSTGPSDFGYPVSILEMKICNYWSESNSLIYFYTVLNKN
jgi:hypothetical protein